MRWQIETMEFGDAHYLRRTIGRLVVWTRDKDVALKFDPEEDAKRALGRLQDAGDPACDHATIVEFLDEIEAA